MIRNYILGQTESLALRPIGQADGSNQYISIDDVYKNGFNSLVLYEDAGGSSPVPNAAYSMTTVDQEWTTDESGTGGTGEIVYSQFIVSDPTYQAIDLYANLKNYGTYTDNDAPFSQLGGALAISASGTIVPSTGYIRQIVTVDTSSGAVSLTVDPPAFIGQEIYYLCDGAGLLTVDFPGKLSTGDVVVSNGLMLRTISKSLTEWSAVNEVTADYVSGTSQVISESSGDIAQRLHLTGTASTPSSNDFGTASGTVYILSATPTFPVTFATIPNDFSTMNNTSLGTVIDIVFNPSTTSALIKSTRLGIGTTVNTFFTIRGKY